MQERDEYEDVKATILKVHPPRMLLKRGLSLRIATLRQVRIKGKSVQFEGLQVEGEHRDFCQSFGLLYLEAVTRDY